MATTHDYVTKADLEAALKDLGLRMDRQLEARFYDMGSKITGRMDILDAKVDALSVQVGGIDRKVGQLVEWAFERPNSTNY